MTNYLDAEALKAIFEDAANGIGSHNHAVNTINRIIRAIERKIEADVPVVEDVASEEAPDATVDPIDGLTCPECGTKCATEHGLKIHIGRAHGGIAGGKASEG